MSNDSPASEPLSRADFIARLEKSKLLSGDQEKLLKKESGAATFPTHSAGAANWLVDRGMVTKWQVQELLAGRTAFFFEKYRLLDRIGSGSMGTVYRAQDKSANRIVALKVMAANLADNPEALERFRREIDAATRLKHPNIITAYEGDSVGQRIYLAMEFLEGQELKRFLEEKGPLPIPLACECLRQASAGLQYAFEFGMLHRDIKPANLFVTWKGMSGMPNVKILDLGLARFVSENRDKRLTFTGQIIGTPDYIAPEAARNTKSADVRSDVFSLGCTLFELLTGKLPFPGKNMVEKLTSRLSTDAPSVRTLRSEIPSGLDAVIAKALKRDPNERYQTPGQVADALVPFVPKVPR